MCEWKPERAFIKGWSTYKEMQWLSSVLWKMKVFPQPTHGHFHSFYWSPPPITPSASLPTTNHFAGADTAAAEVWPAGGECASVCVCARVCRNTWVIQVSFLLKRKSLKWRCILWVCPKHSFCICEGKWCVSNQQFHDCFCNLTSCTKKKMLPKLKIQTKDYLLLMLK